MVGLALMFGACSSGGNADRPYDIHYDLDDQAIYCSELIYKAFERSTGEKLGKLQKIGELKWQAHAPVIREIEVGGSRWNGS